MRFRTARQVVAEAPTWADALAYATDDDAPERDEGALPPVSTPNMLGLLSRPDVPAVFVRAAFAHYAGSTYSPVRSAIVSNPAALAAAPHALNAGEAKRLIAHGQIEPAALIRYMLGTGYETSEWVEAADLARDTYGPQVVHDLTASALSDDPHWAVTLAESALLDAEWADALLSHVEDGPRDEDAVRVMRGLFARQAYRPEHAERVWALMASWPAVDTTWLWEDATRRNRTAATPGSLAFYRLCAQSPHDRIRAAAWKASNGDLPLLTALLIKGTWSLAATPSHLRGTLIPAGAARAALIACANDTATTVSSEGRRTAIATLLTRCEDTSVLDEALAAADVHLPHDGDGPLGLVAAAVECVQNGFDEQRGTDLLNAMATHPDDRLRAAVVPHLLDEDAPAAYDDPSLLVRRVYAAHPGATTEHLSALLNEDDLPLARAVLAHPRVTPDMVQAALDSPHPGVRTAGTEALLRALR